MMTFQPGVGGLWITLDRRTTPTDREQLAQHIEATVSGVIARSGHTMSPGDVWVGWEDRSRERQDTDELEALTRPVVERAEATTQEIVRAYDEIIRKRKKFNGKPLAHWQAMADELVIDALVRAAMPHLEAKHPSLPGYLAAKRLMEIAKAENPTMLDKVLALRTACVTGFQRIMSSLLS